jgi:hypothetical protein
MLIDHDRGGIESVRVVRCKENLRDMKVQTRKLVFFWRRLRADKGQIGSESEISRLDRRLSIPLKRGSFSGRNQHENVQAITCSGTPSSSLRKATEELNKEMNYVHSDRKPYF